MEELFLRTWGIMSLKVISEVREDMMIKDECVVGETRGKGIK